MSRRRIVIHTDGLGVQGNERQIAIIARGLVERGHTVHISARPASPAWHWFAATGAHMSSVRVRGTADVISAARFTRWLRAIAPDAILFTSWRRLWIAAAAARAAGVPNRVMRFGGRHEIPTGWRGAHYRHALHRLVDRIYANSTLVRNHLVDNVGLPPSRVHVVPNGIRPHDATPALLRETRGIPATAHIVTAVGGLVPLKGFDLLIRACSTIESAHVVICGEGPERQRLEQLARSLSCADRLHLLGQCDDVPSVLAAADLFVLSSRTEGFSVALLEAMNAGLPIVATDVGGVRDALCDEQGDEIAGWVVPPEHEMALSDAIRAALTTLREVAHVRARAAQRRARTEFGIEQMVMRVERVLLGSLAAAARMDYTP